MRLSISTMAAALLMVFMILPCNTMIASAEVKENTGEVKGVVTNRADHSPFGNKLLSLMPVEQNDGKLVMTFTFDHESYTDKNGRLSFKDVKPGTYILHCNMVSGFNSETGETILIKVQGGDVVDLGEIMIDRQW